MQFFGTTSAAAAIALNTLNSISAPPVASNGCGKPLPAGLIPGGASVNFTLNSPNGGGERKYLLHLPQAFSAQNDSPAPLILVFHAFTQKTADMEAMTRFSDPDTNTQYIAVFPEGINNVWLGDPGSPNSSVLDDRPFITDLLDTLEETLCIDKARVYTTGFSNGGGLSSLLACYPPTSKRIAAFSGVSAAYYTKGSLGYSLFEEEGCQVGEKRGPTPFLDIHGSADMVIAYDGDNSQFDIDQNGVPDPDTLPISQYLGDWAKRNGCKPYSNRSVNAYLESGDVVSAVMMENDTVDRTAWTCGGWEQVVVGYFVEGLGHGWPSSVPLEGVWEEFRGGPSKWNCSEVLMEWFGRWSLGTGDS